MGALHDGHLSLIDTARENGADRIVVSIFVNPTQFGPNEDLITYPRDLEGDLLHLRSAGVDLLFVPEVSTIYPPDSQSFVTVEHLQSNLCGESRPGHFRGVATVVTLLFNIVQPDMAVFGQKDFQQLQIIRQMVRDLHMGIKIIGSPIVREVDGLAMSSRNQRLTATQRTAALSISQSIRETKKRVDRGEKCVAVLHAAIRQRIQKAGGKVDYVRIVDSSSLHDVSTVEERAHLVIAAFFGETRLIDNSPL